MALFNYGGCSMCKDMSDDVKMTLHNIFPVLVCNKICDYNVYCSRCVRTRHIEVNFLKHPHTKDCEKVELQIRYFSFYNPSLFEDNDLKNVRIEKMKQLIMENAHDDFKKFMIHFYKARYREFKTFWMPNIGRKAVLKEKVKNSVRDYTWTYYNKECRDSILIKLILYEYLLDLIGGDMMYIELDDIHKYLDDIFN